MTAVNGVTVNGERSLPPRGFPLVLAAALAVALSAAGTAQTIAISGGTVYPVSGPKLSNATVLIRDGRIVAVAANLAVPAGALRVDASGKWVTPGLIHVNANAGLGVAGLNGQGEGAVQGDVNPSFNPAEAIDPTAFTIPIARTGGITSGLLVPNGGFFPGQAPAVNFSGDRVEDMLVRRNGALVLDLSSSSKQAGGGSRAGTLARVRRLFDDALEYSRRKADFQRAAMQQLSAPGGRGLAAGAADRGGGCAGRAGTVARHPDLDGLGARLDNATLLRQAGVKVILAQGDPGGERNLRYAAGNAVRNGMSWDDALAAVTLAPASAFGLSDYGTLEPGKLANLVIWSGDPFDFASAPERVYIKGQSMSPVTRETELHDKYRTLPPREP